MPAAASKIDALLRLARKGPIRARDLDKAGIPRAYERALFDKEKAFRDDYGEKPPWMA